MSWLITGGAGYIGAHVVQAMRASGREVVVLDDLSTGERRKVPDDVPFVQVSVRDRAAVVSALRGHDVTGVVHLAAKKAVGESVAFPLRYYRENVEGMLSLLEAMDEAAVPHLVYSSSAAVYGEQPTAVITEDAPLRPTSPYGETKVVGEWMMRDAAAAGGLGWVALRYFNVVGAAADELGDTGVHNLVPLAFRAITGGRSPQVFGDDYPTPDGSCVRDYIDVLDLAEAHVAAADRCESGAPGRAYNVGRGEGLSVLEVLDVVRSVTGTTLAPEVVARRPGDPAALVASADLIRDELGWTASRGIEAMVASAWSAWQSFPPTR